MGWKFFNASGELLTSGAAAAGLTVEDEGSPLSGAATTLDFVGGGVTAAGAGAEKTITIPAASLTKLDDLAAPDDNTDLNASTTRHGLFPKLPGGSTNFWREDGTWQAPGGGSVSDALKAQATSMGAFSEYVPGRYYWGQSVMNAFATGSITLNRLYFFPYYNPTAETFDRITVEVTAGNAAGREARLGLFNSAASGLPGTLLLDAGMVDCSTVGIKAIIISQLLAADTKYWRGIVVNNSGLIFQRIAENLPHYGGSAAFTKEDLIYMAHTYGALPDPAGAVTYLAASATDRAIAIGLRAT